MKITNDKRKEILSVTLDSVFKNRKQALKKEENEIACLIYENIYPLSIQCKMDELPSEFFSQSSEVYVCLVETKWGRESLKFCLNSSKKISARDSHIACSPRLDLSSTEKSGLKTRIQKFIIKRKKIAVDIDNLREKLNTMLYGLNTLKQLCEEWPEGAPYYEKVISVVPKKNLPAVRGKDISEMILFLGEQ